MARELKRININVPLELLARIDEYADKINVNRTSAVLVLCSHALDNDKAVNGIGELMDLLRLATKS